jgi:hypothetical protein
MLSELQTDALEKVLNEFPYFQSARALRLKGLYDQNSFRYNMLLKVTAAHTTDRVVLFYNFDLFVAIQKALFDKETRTFGLQLLIVKKLKRKKENKTVVQKLEQSILSL